jgi:hypothetical protein
MPSMRYRFTGKVEMLDEVYAYFIKDTTSHRFLKLIFGNKEAREVIENERRCKALYEEACANTDDRLITYASADSKEDAQRAFCAIRVYKRQHGISFDVEDIKYHANTNRR